MGTKFQVSIHDIEETKLGTILASLPSGIKPEITRMKARDDDAIAAIKAAAKRRAIKKFAKRVNKNNNRRKPGWPANGRLREAMPAIVSKLPSPFRASDMAALLPPYGIKSSSISYALKKAQEGKLIKRVAGTSNQRTQYEAIQ